ncbi:MAG: deoxyribose-phosphate aldolase [Caldilineae bacterium]|nr:MAG: deoxyribose-phosphate aldolase [Caldilineae bacterium]
MTPELLAGMIDHTILKPDARAEQIRQLCAEARQYGFASVCINPTWVSLAAELLAGTGVKVCTVVGFPLGATLTEVKAHETQAVIAAGADEVDMVLNIGRLKDGEDQAVEEDIRGVVQAARQARPDDPVIVKVILETALLTDAEKRRACRLAQAAGADFVKTSTGFSGGGATPEDVALMRQVVGDSMGVKAAGGVRTAEDALAMIAAGANRIGASAGVAIVEDARRALAASAGSQT